MEPQKGFQMFQTYIKNRYQTPGVGGVLQQAPQKPIKKLLLKKKNNEYIDLNLRKTIMIDIQSTMHLLCNEEMVERMYKLKKKMRIRSNGYNMFIYHKARVSGYIKDVWFDNTSTTNIFDIKNLIQQ